MAFQCEAIPTLKWLDTGLVWERRRRVEKGLHGRIGRFTEQDRIMQKTLDVTMRTGEAHKKFPFVF